MVIHDDEAEKQERVLLFHAQEAFDRFRRICGIGKYRRTMQRVRRYKHCAAALNTTPLRHAHYFPYFPIPRFSSSTSNMITGLFLAKIAVLPNGGTTTY